MFTACRWDPAPSRLQRERYALCMERMRTFFKRFGGGRRPPTGPLTTAETTEAEDLRHETLAKDEKRIVREQEEARNDEV